MFTNLIASRPPRAKSAAATSVSLFLHSALLTTAVIATSQGAAIYEAPRESRVVQLIAPRAPRAEPPPPRAPAQPQQPVVPKVATVPVEIPEPSVAPVEIPTSSDVPIGEPTESIADPSGGVGDPVGPAGPAGPTNGTGTALGATEVDVPASLRANSPLPRYPDALRSRRLEGGVHVRLVVGTNGRVELESVTILDATHPAFAESVRAVLRQLRFTPARVGRKPVRQVVEIPFGFKLVR